MDSPYDQKIVYDYETFHQPSVENLVDIDFVIEETVGNYDFDDVENYSPEYELDYDGRITCSSFNFESYNLVEQIVKNRVNKNTNKITFSNSELLDSLISSEDESPSLLDLLTFSAAFLRRRSR